MLKSEWTARNRASASQDTRQRRRKGRQRMMGPWEEVVAFQIQGFTGFTHYVKMDRLVQGERVMDVEWEGPGYKMEEKQG